MKQPVQAVQATKTDLSLYKVQSLSINSQTESSQNRGKTIFGLG